MTSAEPAPDPVHASADAGSAEDETVRDASPLFLVALRDTAFVLGALSLWAGADAWSQATGAGFGVFLSSATGLLAGAFTAAQLHEWGHFAGARLSGGTAPISPAGKLVPLFLFDFERSDERQFRWMSIGGNLAHWLAAIALFAFVPTASPGGLALACGGLGFAVFASSIEFPVIRRALDGTPGAEALATIDAEGIQRSGWIGLGVALGAFVLL